MAAPKVNAKGKVYHVTNIEKEKGLDWTIDCNRIKTNAIRPSKSKFHPKLFLRRDQATPQNSPSDRNQSSVETGGQDNSTADDISKPMDDLALSESKKTKESVENVKCCFFNTTLYDGRLPDWTPYPLDESKYPFGKFYKRIRVPFNVIYETYPICWFWCAAASQVHYICGKKEQENKIEKAILNGYDDKTNQVWRNSGLTKEVNEYLNSKENREKIKRNETVDMSENENKVTIKTNMKTIVVIFKGGTENILPKIQNDFKKKGEKIFYNIAVCGEVPFNKEDIDYVEKRKEDDKRRI